MENVQPSVALPPVQFTPTRRPRSRRMGSFIELPSLPPPSPMDKPDTPPDSPRNDSFTKSPPSRSSPVPPPPPPPRSPLRSAAKSVSSFKSIMDLYTKRDTMQTLRPRRDEVGYDTMQDQMSLTALLNKLKLDSRSDDVSIDDFSFTEERSEKPLPQPPPDSPPHSPIMAASSSTDTADSSLISALSSEPTITNSADTSETCTLSSNVPSISKREHALKELLSSERAYASDLAFIRDLHMTMALGKPSPIHLPPPTPPSSSGSSSRTRSTASDSSSVSQILGAPMTKTDVRIIFNNISELACFSNAFGDELENALGDVLDDGKGEDYVGALFLEVLPELERLYDQYITKHPAALKHFHSLPRSAALVNYLAQTQLLAQSITHSWDLPSLLIKPVQRVLKYPLLLATIADHTPESHEDKQNLIKARNAIEQIAHRINDHRRRLEVVKGILHGREESSLMLLQKKKLSTAGNASLIRMKSIGVSLRASRSEDDNREAKDVADCEKRLKEADNFIRDLAKSIVAWAQCVRQTQEHLKDWALGFGRTIGISEAHPSEAFNAFLDLINLRLLPLCKELDDVIAKEILQSLARLIDSSKAPKKLLTKMHSFKRQHNDLLNMNISSKNRPSTALMEASQNYLDLRGQLCAELPTYLALLEKGLVACIMQFARYQTQFWGFVRNEWGTLWDCLRMEGETNAGCEETFRLWWMRYSEVEEDIRKLTMLHPKTNPRRNRSQSYDAVSMTLPGTDPSMDSPFGTYPLPPDSLFSGQYYRHRSFGSLDSAAQGPIHRSPSVEAFQQATSPTRSRPQPRSPDSLGRRKGRSHTSPFPVSSSSPTLADYISAHSYSEPKDYAESVQSLNDVQGRQSRSSSFSQRFSESLRAPLRKASSQKSLGFYGIGGRQFIAEPEPLPSYSFRNFVIPGQHSGPYVSVTRPYIPSRAIDVDPPFFKLTVGEIYDVVCEVGHPARYPGLLLDIRQNEPDLLLVLRGEDGDLGLALASYVCRLDELEC